MLKFIDQAGGLRFSRFFALTGIMAWLMGRLGHESWVILGIAAREALHPAGAREERSENGEEDRGDDEEDAQGKAGTVAAGEFHQQG